MSKELKILLIAGGTLFGLILLVAVAGIIALPRLAKGFVVAGHDPKSIATVNAKIANFTIPRGYEETTALNMMIMSIAAIQPIDQPRGRFQIQLQALQMPAGAVPPEQNDQQLLAGMKVGLAQRCSTFEDAGSETIAVRGKPVVFRIVTCHTGDVDIRAEVGNFAAISPYVTVLAVGTQSGFDEKALHALLASVR